MMKAEIASTNKLRQLFNNSIVLPELLKDFPAFMLLYNLKKNAEINNKPWHWALFVGDEAATDSDLQNEKSSSFFGIIPYHWKNKFESCLSPEIKGLYPPQKHTLYKSKCLISTLDGNHFNIDGDKTFAKGIIEKLQHAILHQKVHSFKYRSAEWLGDKTHYIKKVKAIQKHIRFGNIYEANYCTPFLVNNFEGNPFALWQKMVTNTQAQFSAFLKLKDDYILSASPERYLQRQGNLLLSQPMKGTLKKSKYFSTKAAATAYFSQSEKEKAENVMIVDLVRNDFARICKTGSIKVDELFGIYDFNYVWQMISTISGELEPKTAIWDILRATFPMGSMTGAPKIAAMEMINQYEICSRGYYSSALGYALPNGNFDFSVTIRTAVFNTLQKILTYHAGSAITHLSDAEQEWRECNNKIEPLQQILNTHAYASG